nr:hypothetical protein [Tanacetum cinerariifolium]
IYPRLLNQDFIEPPSEDELVSFIQELGYSSKCDMISAIHIDQMHQPWRTFAAIINRCISGKTTRLDRLRESRAQIFLLTQDYQQYGALIPNEMINQDIKDSKDYKTYLDFATGKATPKKARKFKKVALPLRKLSLVLEEKPTEKPKQANESVPKKKTPAKVDRGKGMDLLSNVALLEAAQLKKTLKKSKLETHKLHASGLSKRVGSQPKVPDEQEDMTTGTDEGTDSGDDERNDDDNDEVTKDDDDDDDDVDSDANGDKESSDSKKTDFDEYDNHNLNQNDDEEEEHKEEYVHTPDGIEFTDDDEDSIANSSVSSDFANQFLNLDNVSLTDTEVVSLMNVKVYHEEPSTQTPPLLNIPVTVIPETSSAAGSNISLTIPPITPL